MSYIIWLKYGKVVCMCYIFCTFAGKRNIMIELRINEVLKEHGMKQKELADKMGIKPISLNQMLGRGTFGINRLAEMADIIGCKVTELFDEEKRDTNDFASYIRYKGIHYTADTIEELMQQVDEIRAIARNK